MLELIPLKHARACNCKVLNWASTSHRWRWMISLITLRNASLLTFTCQVWKESVYWSDPSIFRYTYGSTRYLSSKLSECIACILLLIFKYLEEYKCHERMHSMSYSNTIPHWSSLARTSNSAKNTTHSQLPREQDFLSVQSLFFDKLIPEEAKAVGVLMHLRQQIPTPKPHPSIIRAIKPSKIFTCFWQDRKSVV